MRFISAICCTVFIVLVGCSTFRRAAPPPMNQFPSPMAEHIRTHERIPESDVPGTVMVMTDVLPKPVKIYIPGNKNGSHDYKLLIHFHGSRYIPAYAAYHSDIPFIVATVDLGVGSSVYERPFQDERVFDTFIDSIRRMVSSGDSLHYDFSEIYLTSFSAGYGAVRAILRNHAADIDGVILLDGLHTDYIPDEKRLSDGGVLNTDKLEVFLKFAQHAAAGEKRMIITHSEIFPGLYASTTETAEYIVDSLGLTRAPVLKWGPVGMQMVGETHEGNLWILDFAGNAGPDHTDHLCGLPFFLEMLFSQ
ncbi:hypothetical protein LLG96_12745 [bacterium]|nr:hypothetical protein [bacterium]